MLTDEEVKEIRRAADRTIGSELQHLRQENNSTDIAEVIARAIAAAIKEYDSIKNP